MRQGTLRNPQIFRNRRPTCLTRFGTCSHHEIAANLQKRTETMQTSHGINDGFGRCVGICKSFSHSAAHGVPALHTKPLSEPQQRCELSANSHGINNLVWFLARGLDFENMLFSFVCFYECSEIALAFAMSLTQAQPMWLPLCYVPSHRNRPIETAPKPHETARNTEINRNRAETTRNHTTSTETARNRSQPRNPSETVRTRRNQPKIARDE